MLALMFGLLIVPSIGNVGAQDVTPTPDVSQSTETPGDPSQATEVPTDVPAEDGSATDPAPTEDDSATDPAPTEDDSATDPSAALPCTRPDSYNAYQDTTLEVPAPSVFGNDRGPVTLISYRQPLHGTVTLGSAGLLTYVPEAGYTGTDLFTYEVICESGENASAPVSINVAPVDPTPTTVGTACAAVDDTYSTYVNTTLDVPAPGVLVNDKGTKATVKFAGTLPAHGTLNQAPDGKVNYIPDANYVGKDSYTYVIGCEDGSESLATVNIDVMPLVACEAVDDSYTTPMNRTLDVAAPGVLINDKGTKATVKFAGTLPAHGTLNQAPDGKVNYIPDANYVGPDSYTYVIGCADGSESLATVNIDVQPLTSCAIDDSYAVRTDNVLTIDAPGIYGNDLGVNNKPISHTNPAHGTLQLKANGFFIYDPDPGYIGSDSFTYTIQCGGFVTAVDTAAVTIDVEPMPSSCIAVDDWYTTIKNTKVTDPAPGILRNDLLIGIYSIYNVNQPLHGKANVNQQGAFDYTPNAGFVGQDSFTYTMECLDVDGVTKLYSKATVYIDVAPRLTNCAVKDDYYITPMNTKVTDAAPGVWANDTLVGTYALQDVHPAAHGMGVVGSMGEMEYTPDPGFVGTDSYEYVVRCDDDDDDDTTAAFAPTYLTATIHIQVGDDATPPASSCAIDDAYTTPMNKTLNVGAPGIYGNDLGVNNNLVSHSNPTHGQVTLNGDGSFTYVPDQGYTGTDSFDYTLQCGGFVPGTDTATVTINVTPTGATSTPTGKPTVPTVSKLPVTGAGTTSDHGSNSIVLALASLLVLAGGATATMGVRRRRS